MIFRSSARRGQVSGGLGGWQRTPGTFVEQSQPRRAQRFERDGPEHPVAEMDGVIAT